MTLAIARGHGEHWIASRAVPNPTQSAARCALVLWDLGQGAGRGQQRLYQCAGGGCRVAAPTLASLSVFQYGHTTGRGVFVTGFSYSVDPRGKARIRTQMSTALSSDDVGAILDVFGAIVRR